MIYFKEDSLREEYPKLREEIKEILEVMDSLMKALYGYRMVITSIYRNEIGSTHYYYRAADVRTLGLEHSKCKHLENLINFILPYDKDHYQTVVFHNSGSGWHFHVQVKP